MVSTLHLPRTKLTCGIKSHFQLPRPHNITGRGYRNFLHDSGSIFPPHLLSQQTDKRWGLSFISFLQLQLEGEKTTWPRASDLRMYWSYQATQSEPSLMNKLHKFLMIQAWFQVMISFMPSPPSDLGIQMELLATLALALLELLPLQKNWEQILMTYFKSSTLPLEGKIACISNFQESYTLYELNSTSIRKKILIGMEHFFYCYMLSNPIVWMSLDLGMENLFGNCPCEVELLLSWQK